MPLILNTFLMVFGIVGHCFWLVGPCLAYAAPNFLLAGHDSPRCNDGLHRCIECSKIIAFGSVARL